MFELWVRDHAIRKIQNAELWHKYVTARVNGEFQCTLLDALDAHLTDEEKDLVRQGRNAPISVGRRNNPHVHRRASGFETLIGHLHLRDPQRLAALLAVLHPLLDTES